MRDISDFRKNSCGNNNTKGISSTESDFSGTLRDLFRVPVLNGKGGYFEHIGEMKDSYSSFQKIKKWIRGFFKKSEPY